MKLNGRFDCPAPKCEWFWQVGELGEMNVMVRALASPTQLQQMKIAREHLSLAKAFEDHVKADHTPRALMIELLRLRTEVTEFAECLPAQTPGLKRKLLSVLDAPVDIDRTKWAGAEDNAAVPEPESYPPF